MTDGPSSYEVARVRPVAERRTVHTIGRPSEPGALLPLPAVLVLEVTPGAGAMLFRYTAAGEFGGDTWHETPEDARDQAAWEYEGALGPWVAVPDGADAFEFGRRLSGSRPEA